MPSHTYTRAAHQNASLLRPFALLLARSFLPLFVLILLKNPCLRFWMSRVAPDSVGRGPHRICVPASAGCVEMAVRGTRSAMASSRPAAAAPLGRKGSVRANGERANGLWVDEWDAVGRRDGMWENFLASVSYLEKATPGGFADVICTSLSSLLSFAQRRSAAEFACSPVRRDGAKNGGQRTPLGLISREAPLYLYVNLIVEVRGSSRCRC